ncbi:MAG: hypothetical protein MUE81_15585 [Thermoflexibacter sp.]|nr:hypothetical protein [Thermoflexibacter sp.]
MNHTKVALADTNQFANIFIDYICCKTQLLPFYHLFPSIENYEKQITLKKYEISPIQFRPCVLDGKRRP